MMPRAAEGRVPPRPEQQRYVNGARVSLPRRLHATYGSIRAEALHCTVLKQKRHVSGGKTPNYLGPGVDRVQVATVMNVWAFETARVRMQLALEDGQGVFTSYSRTHRFLDF